MDRAAVGERPGAPAALRWLLRESCGNAGLRCVESANEPGFQPEAAVALSRVAQQAIDHVLKHAAAITVSVSLTLDADALRLRIKEEGRGIQPERVRASSTHRLACMRHRVRALRGRRELRTAHGGGAKQLVQLPLAAAVRRPVDPVNL